VFNSLSKRSHGVAQSLARCLACTAAIAVVAEGKNWIPINATTAALYLLLVVLGAATKWGLTESIFTSLVGVLAFNFFFLPPVGTFTIADPQNWAALFAFLVTAVTRASFLRTRTLAPKKLSRDAMSSVACMN
jgi:two-component system sensor histidine kinase KdpD